jgi:ABC-type nitrate/sulfonate/bicarbonate transport system substrate-binding protein
MSAVAGALVVAVTAALWLPVAPVEAQKPMTIRLGVHTALMGAPDIIAIRSGFFKQEGLDVQWRRFSLGKEGRDAMIAGHIDVNNTAPVPFLVGLDKGVPYTAIAVNSYFCGINQMVVAKNADINSVAQLKGKKVGMPKGTITEFIFQTKTAPAHGLKPGDYQVANIPDSKDRIPSLVAKAVDAVVLNEPFTSIGEHEGVIRVIEDFCKYDPLPFMTTATTKIVKENPDAVVAYLRGWMKAIKLLKEDPEKAAEVYLEDLKSLGRDIPKPVLVKALGRMRWEPAIDATMDKYLHDIAKDMLAAPAGASDRIKAMPDLGKGVNKELLAKAAAGR